MPPSLAGEADAIARRAPDNEEVLRDREGEGFNAALEAVASSRSAG
jgi:hypothetical protein